MSGSELSRDLEEEEEIARELAQEGQGLPWSDDEGVASAPAVAPSVAPNRRRRQIPVEADDEDEDEDEDAADADDEEMEEANASDSESVRSDGESVAGVERGFQRHVEHDDDDDDDDDDSGQSEQGRSVSARGAPGSTSHLLHQGLNQLPGWSEEIHGAGIDPIPPVFATALPDTWSQWSNDGPFGVDQKLRPARVLKVGFIAAWQMQKDGEYVGDIETQTDPAAQARTIATCALMGIQTMGTAKGFLCSSNHSELTSARASDLEEDDLKKLKQRLNGKLKSYTYCPNRRSSDPVEREETAMQFCWGLCYCYDEQEKFIGFNYYMLIFDKGFSNDELVKKLIEENAEIKRQGLMCGVPEEQRNQRMERQNKLQRAQVSDEDLAKSSWLKWKLICHNGDYLKMMECVGGKTEGNCGRPFYNDIQRDTPPNCAFRSIERDDEFGGRHPIGPSISHNHKRFELPNNRSPGDPGINASLAGMLDAKGRPLGIHSSLRDPRDWYDAEGNFEPPQHVRDNGWFYVCHDPSVTNLFKAPLPHKMHGSVAPADCLLKIFWDLHKNTSPILKKAQERGKLTFEENRDSVLALFHHEQDTMDPDQARLSRAVNDTDMLSSDSLDKSAAEEARIEYRAYGDKKTSEKHGDMWVLSVRQALVDVSIDQEKVHAMTQQHDKRRRAEISSADYAARQAECRVHDQKEETRKRQRDHAEATDAAVRLGLQRFQHTFERKKARKMIPPGWYDVANTGLKEALREAGDIAARRATCGLGRSVNPEDPDAAVGTANIGQAHRQSYIATDFTAFGQWRAFIMHLFSAGVRISGDNVKLMLECYIHAVCLCTLKPFSTHSHAARATAGMAPLRSTSHSKRCPSSFCCAVGRERARACGPSGS